MRILLAEDDELLGSGIRAGLAQNGFQVDWVRDGVAAERELATGAYQAAVLDLGLPRQDGMEVLRQVRARRNTTPVLVLTARDAVPARIAGLDAGADDFMVKPVYREELRVRVRAGERILRLEEQLEERINALVASHLRQLEVEIRAEIKNTLQAQRHRFFERSDPE